MARRVTFLSTNKLSSGLLILTFLLALTIPQTARGQGLEVGSGWVYVSGAGGTNGFNFAAAWWFTHRVTLVADYDTAWNTSTLSTFTFTQLGGTASKAHIQNLLFGPRIFFSTGWTKKHKINPFGEGEFGLTHLSETIEQVNSPTISSSDTGFTWMLGGGAEYLFSPHWSARANLDFLRTHLANEGQSHLRFVLGVRYTFGSRERSSASATPQSQPPDTAQVLMGLEQQWAEALQKADVRVLETILGATYVDTDEMGFQTDKHGVISDLTSGNLKVNSMKLSDMQVRDSGSTATVTGRAVQDSSFKGQPLADSIIFTDTFHKENGTWKAVASQRTGAHKPAVQENKKMMTRKCRCRRETTSIPRWRTRRCKRVDHGNALSVNEWFPMGPVLVGATPVCSDSPLTVLTLVG
jgi:opacity protein-like surface antigen